MGDEDEKNLPVDGLPEEEVEDDDMEPSVIEGDIDEEEGPTMG